MSASDLDASRHHCREADELYRDGLVAIFYDASYPAWFMAHSVFAEWEAWEHDRTQPFPFCSRDQDHYDDRCVGILFCPWCGTCLQDLHDAD